MNLIKRARALRKNMTDAERKLWAILRRETLCYKFRRQAPIGRYIVDFVCFEKKLVIEVDGGQHLNSVDDQMRDQWLQSQGFRVMRFWNNEVLTNLSGVAECVRPALEPLPNPPHKGEGVSSPLSFDGKGSG